MPPDILTLTQFQQAIAAALLQFSQLRKKHPTLKAYLVLSSRSGQTKFDSELADAIREFPVLLLDGAAKTKALELIKKLKPKESNTPEQIQLKDEFKELTKSLDFNGSVQVELRFNQLDYDLIPALQTDVLVDRDLTPQTRASIRIALGTINHFSGV